MILINRFDTSTNKVFFVGEARLLFGSSELEKLKQYYEISLDTNNIMIGTNKINGIEYWAYKTPYEKTIIHTDGNSVVVQNNFLVVALISKEQKELLELQYPRWCNKVAFITISTSNIVSLIFEESESLLKIGRAFYLSLKNSNMSRSQIGNINYLTLEEVNSYETYSNDDEDYDDEDDYYDEDDDDYEED